MPWLALLWSRNGIIAIGIVALVVYGQVALKVHDRKVEQRAVAQTIQKIETANEAAANLGATAARKSRDPAPAPRRFVRVRGPDRDPSTRDD